MLMACKIGQRIELRENRKHKPILDHLGYVSHVQQNFVRWYITGDNKTLSPCQCILPRWTTLNRSTKPNYFKNLKVLSSKDSSKSCYFPHYTELKKPRTIFYLQISWYCTIFVIKTCLHFALKSCYIHVIVTSVMRQKLFKFELMFYLPSKVVSCCFNVTLCG